MSVFRRLSAGALTALLVVLAAVAAPTLSTAAGAGQLTITNLDVLPTSTSAVMTKIQNPADSSQRMHDKVTLQLKNTGTSSLTVTALSATGPFTATSPWKIPFTLTSGNWVNITLAFTATTGAWHTGAATVEWTTAGQPATSSVSLTGWWQKYSEKGLEPHLNDLVRNFGYGTVMPTAIYSRGAYQSFSADEVLSPYWVPLDAAQPVRITQIAAWRGYPTGVVVSRYAQGSSTALTQVFSGLKNDAQSAYPRNASWNRGTATFSNAGPFGLKVDTEFTDPKLNDQTVDRAAGCKATQCGQHLRVFKARDADGTLVPGRYLIAQDYGGINYDYNDNVFVVENLQPAS